MDLLKDKIRPMYYKYLFAASGSAMVASVFGLVDAMMVGQYHGPAGTAALAVFNPLWSIIYSLGFLAGLGGSVLFANCRGSGDEEKAQQYFTLSIIYGLILSAAAMLAVALFKEPMFRLFGADDELLALTKKYLACIFFAFPCCVFSSILSAYLRNDANPGLATKAVIIGGVFNAIGDYLCIFVLDMGIFGAGLATAIGQYIAICVMLLHFTGKKNTLRLVRPKKCLRRIWKITVTGFPTCISDLAMGIISVLFNRQIMFLFNSSALAVYGVISQVTAFAQCLSYGIGQAAQPIISQNYGAGRFSRIKECLRHGLYSSALMGTVWAGAMLLFPDVFIRMFMEPTADVSAIAPGILRAYGISYLFLPFNLFATYYFQALMRPNIAMAASLYRGVVVCAAAIILMPMILGPEALWYSMLVTEIIVMAYSIFHMRRCTKSLC